MKTKFFTLLCLIVFTSTGLYAQTIQELTSFTNNTTNDVYTPMYYSNNTSSKVMEAIFAPGCDLSNVTMNAKFNSGTVVVGTAPTDFSNGAVNISLSRNGGAAINYSLYAKVLVPASLPFSIPDDVNYGNGWTSTTQGWASAILNEGPSYIGYARFSNAKTPGAGLIIAISGTPDSLFYSLNLAATSSANPLSFTVEESADGSTWTSVATYNETTIPVSNGTPAEKAQKAKLLSTTKYVRFVQVTKGSADISLTAASITKKEEDGPATNITNTLSSKTTIYPTQTMDVLNIRSNEIITSVNICDMTGQTVAIYTNPNQQINVSELPKGIYMANLIAANGQKTTKRFVKQ